MITRYFISGEIDFGKFFETFIHILGGKIKILQNQISYRIPNVTNLY